MTPEYLNRCIKIPKYKIDSEHNCRYNAFKVDLTSFHSGSLSPYGAFNGGYALITVKEKQHKV